MQEAEPRRCAECDCEGGEMECNWMRSVRQDSEPVAKPTGNFISGFRCPHHPATRLRQYNVGNAELEYWSCEECHSDDFHRRNKPAPAPAVPVEMEAYRYAVRLASSMWEKHYPEAKDWSPLDTTLGVLTQIDNMVTGLCRAQQPAPQDADQLRAENERLRDALTEAEGCFAAAEVEGLYDRINAKEFYDDGDIYGLVVRRLLPAAEVIRAALQRKAGE